VKLPGGAAAAVERYLDAVDAAAPGLIVGLHAVGSLALGDYHPDHSDIDIVAVVADVPDAAQRSLLSEVHRVVATRVDGPYVPAATIGRRPEEVGPVAYHIDGRFEFGDCHELSPVTWAILAEHAVTVRGPHPVELGLTPDVEAVKAFSAANLAGYWSRWARTIAALLDGTVDDDVIEARLLEWGVLGASRVHCAARTGRVISKRAGGEYALERFPESTHDLVRLAIDARDREIYDVTAGQLRRACAFVADACAAETSVG
jgi:hypothetical protein